MGKVSLDSLLEKTRTETGADFKASDFLLIEKRALATRDFSMYVQSISMVPVAKTAIRIWTYPKSGELILVEMHLDENTQFDKKILQAKYL